MRTTTSLIYCFLLVFGYYSQMTPTPPLSIVYKLEIIENITPPMEGTEDLFISEEMLNDPNLQEDPAIIHHKENLLLHQNDKNGLISIYILFENTNNIKKIHYKLGRTQGSNDLVEGFSEFDNYDINNKVIFSHVENIENQIRLDLGLYMNIEHIFGEFQIEDTIGNRSTVLFKENHL